MHTQAQKQTVVLFSSMLYSSFGLASASFPVAFLGYEIFLLGSSLSVFLITILHEFFDSIVIIPFPLSFLVTFLLVAFPHRHSLHAFLPMPFSPCPLPHALPPTPTLHHNLLMLAWHCTKRSQVLHTPYHFHTGPSSASPLSFPSL